MASRRVLQFNTFTFATNQAGFPKNPELLRQRGLGKLQITIGQKGGAVHGAVSLGQFRVDANPDRVGEGIQKALHGYFFQRRMIKWPHKNTLSQLDKIVQLFGTTELVRQSRLVGTARRGVRGRWLPGRSPRRGDPTLPTPNVTQSLPTNNGTDGLGRFSPI